jgi:amidophosphoribosyltransferase
MCAIFGIGSHKEAAKITYLGLHALQHRGQEGAGIVSTDGDESFHVRRKGHVGDVFTESVLSRLKGTTAIGHTRYSTTGANNTMNLQPLTMKCALGWVGLAHNGNLVNAGELTRRLEREGAIFQSTNDTEVLIHLMARSKETDLEKALMSALKEVNGAYSLLVLTRDKLIAVRDPHGFRPLVIGEFASGPVFASETTAFDLIGATYQREVAPGEMIVVPLEAPRNLHSYFPFAPALLKRCVFELIYFARPDSNLYGKSVHEMRKAFGRRLAQEQPAPSAEVVIPVPDSGVPGAIGFSELSKVPFDMAIIRSHYIGRTFIEPEQGIRDFGVRLKLAAVRGCVEGKNIVVVDDSLVRGTTCRKLVKLLRDCGAREIHVRITAPPTAHPCFYGIDTPTKAELLASSNPVEKIRTYIGADTLGYLSLEGLLSSASGGDKEPGFCHACFSGDYPTPVG